MHVRLNPIIRKELELSQVEIEVQSLRIVAELLEEADQEEARKPGCVRYLLMIGQSIILPGHLVEIRKDL